MRKLILIWILLLGIGGGSLQAGEGMWLPILLQSMENEMQTAGLKLTAEDLYSVNNSSLKDAVLLFGGGCTGAVVSPDGLLLTNHHCGYGRIQSHSSVDNDYLTDGFWAGSRDEELPNPGLSVTFIVRMEDVTDQVLAGISEETDEEEREQLIGQRSVMLARSAVAGTHYRARVQPFYYGNEYILIVMETFTDVRLVGAPPEGIGKFGGDTDNWVWPRHNADFSMFRIYTGPDGLPADYAEENIPMRSRHYFPISLKAKQPGDFTMVYGFPGTTQSYLPATAVEMLVETVYPLTVDLRDRRLNIIDREMAANDTIRIQYASKQSSISNGYKKWQGAIWGMEKTDGLDRKQSVEKKFNEGLAADPELQKTYGDILPAYADLYSQMKPVMERLLYYSEGALGIESVKKARGLFALERALDSESDEELAEAVQRLQKSLPGFFKNYSRKVDQQLMAAMLDAYMEGVPEAEWPDYFEVIQKKYKGDTKAFAQKAFAQSFLVNENRFQAFLDQPSIKTLEKDLIFSLTKSMSDNYRNNILPAYTELSEQTKLLHRRYMAAQREVFTEKTFYPDANLSLRLAYGKIEGFSPKDGMEYRAFTSLDGLIEKGMTQPNNPDYHLNNRLVELYRKGDFGKYGQEGTLWTCFIASNHTTGGNSGSPVLDAEGNLIGLNFDRNWEGTMSDLNYDVSQCRNISVDVRYILWLVDSYAGAGYLLEEMNLILPEKETDLGK